MSRSDKPEHQLLLDITRTCSEANRRFLLLNTIEKCLDWDYLLEIAGEQGMASQLYWYLYQLCPDAMPETVKSALQNHFRGSAGSGLFLTGELIKILDLFEKNQIEAIPFKGPSLAYTLYENPAMREYGDLDIFIREAQVFKALNLLSEIGYRKIPEYGSRVQEQILKREWQYQLLREDEKGFVEIHWTVMPWYSVLPLPTKEWWQRVETIQIQDHSVNSFCPEDLFVALAVHGGRHQWESLNWISDLVRLLGVKPDLDLALIYGQASNPDLSRVITLAFAVVRDLLSFELPMEIQLKIQEDQSIEPIANRLRADLFKEKRSFYGPLLQLRLRTTWKTRLRYCFRMVTTPTLIEWNRTGLPGVLFPVYFLMRPFRLLLKYAGKLLGKQ